MQSMAEHKALIEWQREGAAFADGRYSRGHRWTFDGGIEVPASASPHVVPLPLSVARAVDPEVAFVASLASCHMLWFLSLAAQAGFVVESYRDEAVGSMERDAAGKLWMARVTLLPDARFGGPRRPTRAEVAQLHERAHEECFIARSVRTDVRCEPLG
jgi:organic hydroperoxide reductase OsmC/OhrA